MILGFKQSFRWCRISQPSSFRPQAQTCHCCCAFEPLRCIPAGLATGHRSCPWAGKFFWNWAMFRRSIYWTLGFSGFLSDSLKNFSPDRYGDDFLNLPLCTSRFNAITSRIRCRVDRQVNPHWNSKDSHFYLLWNYYNATRYDFYGGYTII